MHPIGMERCFHKFMGGLLPMEFLCCVEDLSNCFPQYEMLYQCPPLRKGYDPEHPIGLERCFKKYEGKPWQLEVLCCIKDPSNCFPGFETEKCIKCPPLRKGDAPSTSPGAAPGPI
uniref:Uncharacterized protein n=1 Tax=Brassica campestris TaxID=3711 RepID=M4CM12_BRACM